MREVIIIVIISVAQWNHSLWLGPEVPDRAFIRHTEGQYEEEEEQEGETCPLLAP